MKAALAIARVVRRGGVEAESGPLVCSTFCFLRGGMVKIRDVDGGYGQMLRDATSNS